MPTIELKSISPMRRLLEGSFDFPMTGFVNPVGPENYDRIGMAQADQENPECQFVRNGIFTPIKGALASSQLYNTAFVKRRHLVTDQDYVSYLQDEEREQKSFDDLDKKRHGPSFSYNPAYSDYLPLLPSYSKTAHASDKGLVPLVWTVPFRAGQGTYCGYRHVQEGSNKGAVLHEVCGDCFFIRASKLHCWRPGCPVCGWDWATKKAMEVQERMEAFESVQDEIIGQGWRHVVISPPQEAAEKLISTKQGLDYLYKYSIKLATDSGLKTGMIALHPWRRNGKDQFEDSVTGEIKKEQSFLWRVGPHFHLICWGRININTADLYDRTGWTMKMIGGSEDRESLSGTIAYILSHVGLAYPVRSSGVGRQLKAFRLFGPMANGTFRRLEVIEQNGFKCCPNCEDHPYLHYLDDRSEQVPYVKKIQVFCMKKDVVDIRKEIRQLKFDLRSADLDDDFIKFSVLDFYKKDPRVALASKRKRMIADS